MVPANSVMVGRSLYLLANPEVEPYIDRATLGTLTGAVGVFLASAVVLTGIGLLLRRAGRESRLYLHIVHQTWWLIFAFVAYIHGPSTTPLWALFPPLGFFCLLLFDTRIALAGIATAVGALWTAAILERLELLPTRPSFSADPGWTTAWPMNDSTRP